MLWLVAAAVVLLAAAIFLVARQWIAPWRQLDRLAHQIARGEQPPTFLVSGNRHAWRVGVALETLLRRQRELDEQLSREGGEMRRVFDALSDAVVVLDKDDRVRLSNPAFGQLFGGRPIASGTALLDVVRDAGVIQTLRRAVGENGITRADLVVRSKTFHLVAMPIADGARQTRDVIGIFHDVTQLRQTDQMRRDLVANVSHELRTPLSIFRGNIETLLEDENLGADETRHILSTIKRHSERLNRIVEDLLTLARLESTEIQLQLGPVDLAAFLRRVAHDWARRFAQKNLAAEVEVESGLRPLRADEFRLEQVMHNLLDNAVNYSPIGGHITIAAKQKDEHVVLSVSDQGPGIPPADLPHIFERFYRADKARSREFGGTGLGLSIVKHIAQLHGGDVQAESRLGEGTTIAVLLPALR